MGATRVANSRDVDNGVCFVGGAGAMMVGHERFCSLEQGCKPCPVCNGTVISVTINCQAVPSGIEGF